MKRLEQVILIVSFACFCWLAMQAVHELGHIIGALTTGGQITQVVLHPLHFSRTDISPNPHPAIVVWLGPTVGSTLPLLAYGIAKITRCPYLYLFRVFAAFCLIANGAYIAFGPDDAGMDTAVMLQSGTPRWLMTSLGLPAAILGVALLNNQGKNFGFGKAEEKIDPHAVTISVILLGLVITLELLFG